MKYQRIIVIMHLYALYTYFNIAVDMGEILRYNNIMMRSFFVRLLNNWSPWRLRAEIKRLKDFRNTDKDHIKRAHAALTAKEPNAGKAIEILEEVHPSVQYTLKNLFKKTYGDSVKYLIPQPVILNKKPKKRKKNY